MADAEVNVVQDEHGVPVIPISDIHMRFGHVFRYCHRSSVRLSVTPVTSSNRFEKPQTMLNTASPVYPVGQQQKFDQ